MAIELVVEDRPHRAIAERADLDRAGAGGVQARGAKRSHQAHNAETSAEALLGMWPMLEDLLAQGGGRRADAAGVLANALNSPAGVTTMTGGHVLRHGRVSAVAARTQMHGDPLAFDEDLDRARGQTCFDLGASEAVRHAVEVLVELDVVIDADTAQAPLGQDIRFDRQGFEVRPIEFFEKLPARSTEPAQHPLLVEAHHQIGDDGVQFGQTVEAAVAQASEQPALDNTHASLDLGLVARPPRSSR